MDLIVKKYRKNDEIIINCFDTWSVAMQNLIIDNYELIENYRIRENEISYFKDKYKSENKIYKINELKNEYYSKYRELHDRLYQVILSENKQFICFHASRYTINEKERILKNGLKTSSVKNLNERIKWLQEDGYIDKNESELLSKKNLLIKKENRRENQIWVTIGNVNIAYSPCYGLYNFYDNYGGEIQYYCIENSPLGDKLNKLSKPYLVVLKLRPTQIVEYGLKIFMENILNNIKFKNSKNVEYEFFTEDANVSIDDIIEIDGNSKIII